MVLKLAHDSLTAGHLGNKKALNRILAGFFWLGVCDDVTRFCRSSADNSEGACNQRSVRKITVTDTLFKRVTVDIVGPIEPRPDMKSQYILTMIDYFPRIRLSASARHPVLC